MELVLRDASFLPSFNVWSKLDMVQSKTSRTRVEADDVCCEMRIGAGDSRNMQELKEELSGGGAPLARQGNIPRFVMPSWRCFCKHH